MVFPQSYATVHQFNSHAIESDNNHCCFLNEDLLILLPITGEKLSKQELHVNNTVKKLRAKEKENEAVLKKNR